MALIPLLCSLGVVALVLFAYTAGLPALAGPAPTRVAPTLANRSLTQARDVAERQGIELNVAARIPTEDLPKDQVIEQNPPPGSALAPGQAIDVTVSGGLKPPRVVGKTLDQARVDLLVAGWPVAPEVETRPAGGPPNVVVAQKPAPDEAVDARTPVTLIVSQRDLAYNKPTRTSAGQTAAEAVDGQEATAVRLADRPPRWLEIDFGAPVTVASVALQPLVAQPGSLVVELWAWDAGGKFFPLQLITEEVADGQTLQVRLPQPAEGIVRLRVATTVAPAGFGWREIAVADR